MNCQLILVLKLAGGRSGARRRRRQGVYIWKGLHEKTSGVFLPNVYSSRKCWVLYGLLVRVPRRPRGDCSTLTHHRNISSCREKPFFIQLAYFDQDHLDKIVVLLLVAMIQSSCFPYCFTLPLSLDMVPPSKWVLLCSIWAPSSETPRYTERCVEWKIFGAKVSISFPPSCFILF